MKYIAPKTMTLIVKLNSALCSTSPTGGLNSVKGGDQLSPARILYI